MQKALPGVKDEAEAQSAAAVDARLVLWMSPAFPTGGFAFSHGLEQAAAAGWVKDVATLEAWLSDTIAHGALRNDLILLRAARCAVIGGDLAELEAVNDLALAYQPAAERRLETVTQGNAFLGTILAAWPHPDLDAARSRVSGDIAYPVAVGAVTAAHDVPQQATLVAYAVAFVGNLASAAIRLSVVGQTDAQRVQAALLDVIETAAAAAAKATLDDLGGATLRADLAQLAHETLYTRLFRS